MKKVILSKYIPVVLFSLMSLVSCKKYLDVVPDNVATIDYAFRNRDEAEKFLFTCYSYLPNFGDAASNVGIMGGDEYVVNYPTNYSGDLNPNLFAIPMGKQNVVSPYGNYWDGDNGGKPYFRALRDCNIFFENVDKIIDITPNEKKRWVAEVKFLKAYYHYYLLRMYGPIPIIKTNKPISSSVEEVRVFRDPADEVVNYIIQLLDEASPDLPVVLMSEASELGRITRNIALSVKAEVLVTAASPLFNGNADYANFKNSNGTQLMNPVFSKEKWDKAAAACKIAIDACDAVGMKLYYFTPRTNTYNLSDTTLTQMNVRGAITEKWNTEIIWGGSNSYSAGGYRGLQANAQAQLSPVGYVSAISQNLAVPIKIAELFYSKNGVPIEEDPSFNFTERFTKLRTGDADNRFNIKEGTVTAEINFNREPRFYANLGFDGGVWYGSGQLNDKNPYYVEHKLGKTAGTGNSTNFNISGYFPKKLVNYANSITFASNSYTIEDYPWPIMRLSELYLLYAEALNESAGPSSDVYKYVDLVRTRAGLDGIVSSYAAHSTKSSKPLSKDGLREAIQRERLIEIALEGKRFWDIRRWKTAATFLSQPLSGWNILGTTTETYYRVQFLYPSIFKQRDYFFPISENAIITNKNLVQNPGW
ncbi:RagB/SusD family nutrient uptake outer membrane protein [Pedobacter nyackensis]|uniref:RagB/SusD family nutrient uptake outer membrane protein n=1 Tax=Pedobacter nyackensis TaxID=475255 RepID=UPI00292F7A34|nr:RagB/SusD family nutrient uptake outer membrane protein [Pedobacter nyackensis]